jgi:ABC-type glycerol-3-phosphate transport system substrate-binding protein
MEVPSAVIISSLGPEESESTSHSTSNSSFNEKNINIRVRPTSSGHSPSDEAYKLPSNAGGEGDDAFANDPSVFDDAEKAKLYWPRSDYEGLHRFFPDFKWTVSEEKR